MYIVLRFESLRLQLEVADAVGYAAGGRTASDRCGLMFSDHPPIAAGSALHRDHSARSRAQTPIARLGIQLLILEQSFATAMAETLVNTTLVPVSPQAGIAQ